MKVDEKHETLASLFRRRVEMDPHRDAILVPQNEEYVGRSWHTLAGDVTALANELQDHGVQVGDRVLQWSDNCYSWIVCDLAALITGAIHVPVHAPLTGVQATYQLTHSGSKLAILAGEDQVQKLSDCALPNDVQYFTHSNQVCELQGVSTKPLKTFVSTTRGDLNWPDSTHIQPDTIATILYTSGTTGEPKGVVLTHSNIVSNVAGVFDAFPELESDVRLCFLPLSHIYARTCDLYTWIVGGSTLALARSRETILADCQLIKPTMINGVPYFYERVQRGLTHAGHANTPGALGQLLGGNIRACCAGGAALPNHVYDFFANQHIPILQGYGLTESSPVICVSRLGECKRGTVGPPLSNVEIRIAEDGEILSRGPHIMQGYWQDLAATSTAIQNGWLHTGDLGEIDDDGYLKITGRKKEIIVTATGKKHRPSIPGVITMPGRVDRPGNGHRRRSKVFGGADRS